MAILHGNWFIKNQGECLFIWGETWRKNSLLEVAETPQILSHPLAMTASELTNFFKILQEKSALNWSLEEPKNGSVKKGQSKKTNKPTDSPENQQNQGWQIQAIALPTYLNTAKKSAYPLHSATTEIEDKSSLCLYPWQVEGICLNPAAALQFLQALPLGNIETTDNFLGADLRFWSQVARWSLDLLARCKFLPGLEHRFEGSVVAKWQPLLDSATDQSRLERFVKQMPVACRTYQPFANSASDRTSLSFSCSLLSKPQELLRDFLGAMIDAQVRTMTQEISPGAIASPVRDWLQALGSNLAIVDAPAAAIERLEAAVSAWSAPLQYQLAQEQLFHAAFHLHPPANSEKDWTLTYCLQAADDADFVVDATTIWNAPFEQLSYRGRIIEQPQETLLRGLGIASRLYPPENNPIEPTLHEPCPHACHLAPLQAYEFLKNGAWRFSESGLGVILPPSLANQEGWASRLGLSIRAQPPKLGKKDRLGLQSLLNFKWELSIGGQRLSKTEFDKLVAKNSPLVEVNGEWVELRSQDIKAAQNFFASRKDQMELSLEDALRLATGDSQTIEKLPVVNFEASGKLQELFSNLLENRAPEAIAPPENFRGELRPYQSLGVGWLAFLQRWGLGACLADDMGLGKTIQTIAFLLHLQAEDSLESPVLLICPTSVLGNWQREVKKFAPDLKVVVHHGDKRPKAKAFAKAVSDKNLVITSYALVYRDIQDLQSVSWQGVVLDEAQNIKNPEAKQSQAVRQLETQFRIALTGTPVENRLQELWSILDFLNPGYLGPRNFFQRRFAIPIEKYGDTASLQTLRSLVQPFILRRLKSDRNIIQDLPEKQEMTVFCPLSAEQAAIYEKLVEESLANIESAEGIQRHGMILALLTKLKQVCNHPSLLKEENAKKSTKSSSIAAQTSGKLQRLNEMLEEVLSEGDRALIFTQFAEWGKLLQPYLEKQLNREILFLYGSTSKQQREEMIDRFQQDPQGPPIMILSLKAGGTGLNLTRANHVFHFDRWWNPAVENQATDRVFRIGQTRNVQVHKFVCTGTLEEKIHDIIESKKALAEQVVGEGESWLTQLDSQQLRNLLLLDRNAVIEEE